MRVSDRCRHTILRKLMKQQKKQELEEQKGREKVDEKCGVH
ncbi:MAG: hypothetical protein RTU92_04260 [Candidatus Thorarchaeota archaeon]